MLWTLEMFMDIVCSGGDGGGVGTRWFPGQPVNLWRQQVYSDNPHPVYTHTQTGILSTTKAISACLAKPSVVCMGNHWDFLLNYFAACGGPLGFAGIFFFF